MMSVEEILLALKTKGWKPAVFATNDGWQLQVRNEDGSYTVYCNPSLTDAMYDLWERVKDRTPASTVYRVRESFTPSLDDIEL